MRARFRPAWTGPQGQENANEQYPKRGLSPPPCHKPLTSPHPTASGDLHCNQTILQCQILPWKSP